MKNLKEYLTEGYWTSTSTADHLKGDKQQPIKANDKNLKDIVKQEIKKLGNDADLNHIDVSNVTKMDYVFSFLPKFNGNISKWDVSNVTKMTAMFSHCDSFTGEGLENWDVSNVQDMSNMFRGCEHLNVDLSNWDVSKVKRMDCMFVGCKHMKTPSWYKE